MIYFALISFFYILPMILLYSIVIIDRKKQLRTIGDVIINVSCGVVPMVNIIAAMLAMSDLDVWNKRINW